jgi:hypothetical protein
MEEKTRKARLRLMFDDFRTLDLPGTGSEAAEGLPQVGRKSSSGDRHQVDGFQQERFIESLG